MSGCVPEQLEPERGPATLKNEHLETREERVASGSQGSQGPANENKRTRSAGDGHGHSSGDEKAVGTGCVLESAHSTCGRQPKVAFAAACAPFFGT